MCRVLDGQRETAKKNILIHIKFTPLAARLFAFIM